MAQEVTVMDAEPESDHMQVGNHRAKRAYNPYSFWGARAVEAGLDA